ncbi:thiolase family protein, partial [Pseudonocardia abyssalis]|uniref:thiolase family protein n=1 Tax=Pseudonocardia abyssalis TaxID=2792008 RepID=UPI001CF7679F
TVTTGGTVTAHVYGVGTSAFGKQPELSAAELGWRAVTEAVTDAALDPGVELDAVYVGSVLGAPGVAQRTLHGLGIVGVPVIAMENACASGTTAYHEAVAAVELGRYRTVLALGIEQLSTLFGGAIHPEASDPEGRAGLAQPGHYALTAQRYLALGLVTPEELAHVAVTSSRYAVHNPRAQHRREIDVDRVLGSRMIADPLTLLQCCSVSDGAAAAVVGAPRGVARDVPVLSSVLSSGALWDYRDAEVPAFGSIRDTAQEAYRLAGVGISDVDVVELHDAFTIGEIVGMEALGIAGRGEAGAMVAAGDTGPGGAHPVNPSGGLLARGHPLGATGLAQIAEIVWQLRGDAGGRQVEGARIGLVETMGGGVSGIDANACLITLLGAR